MEDFLVCIPMIDEELAAGRLVFFVYAKNAERAEGYLLGKGYHAASEPASHGMARVRAWAKS